MGNNLQEGFLISQKLRELLFFQSWVTFLYAIEQLRKLGNMSIQHQPRKDTSSVISVITNAFLQLLDNAAHYESPSIQPREATLESIG